MAGLPGLGSLRTVSEESEEYGSLCICFHELCTQLLITRVSGEHHQDKFFTWFGGVLVIDGRTPGRCRADSQQCSSELISKELTYWSGPL